MKPPKRSWPRRMLNRMEVDQAVFFAVVARYWQFMTGPITLVLVVQFFTPEVQGFYYAFWSVIGLQVFLELAFPQTVITLASHTWSKLQLDDRLGLTGDLDAASRLTDLYQTTQLLFFALAGIFAVIVGYAGLWFFGADAAASEVVWRAPWLWLTAISAITFAFIPSLAVLEGCGQVKSIYQFNLIRNIAGSLAVWAVISWGGGLWAPVAAAAMRLLCEWALLAGRYRRFFIRLWQPPLGARVEWRKEVWPFQSRLLARGLFNYLNADLMLPVVFRYQDAAVAGQFGMTWNILLSVSGACSAWVRTRTPQFGALVASKSYRELDRIFFRVSWIGLAMLAVMTSGFVMAVWILSMWEPRYANRFLAMEPTLILAVGSCAALAMSFQWYYLHAHGKSPYLGISLLGCCLSGLLIWILGMKIGVLGVATAYAVMHALIYLPLSTWGFMHLRRKWHSDEP